MRPTFLIPLLCAAGAATSSAAFHFRYDPVTRQYSVEASGVALEPARLGIEINGTVRWASHARHAAWNGGTQAEIRVRFRPPVSK